MTEPNHQLCLKTMDMMTEGLERLRAQIQSVIAERDTEIKRARMAESKLALAESDASTKHKYRADALERELTQANAKLDSALSDLQICEAQKDSLLTQLNARPDTSPFAQRQNVITHDECQNKMENLSMVLRIVWRTASIKHRKLIIDALNKYGNPGSPLRSPEETEKECACGGIAPFHYDKCPKYKPTPSHVAKIHCLQCGCEILVKAKPDGRCTECHAARDGKV